MKPNANTLALVEDIISFSEELRIDVKKKEQATLLDCSDGGYDAGAYFSEICLGAFGSVGYTERKVSDTEVPAVQVHTDFPLKACIDCQKANWVIKNSIASGPARCLNNKNNEIVSNSLEEEYAILALETSSEPNQDLIEKVSKECGVDKNNIFILYAPTNSLVGSIQISARIIETALHKLDRNGYNTKKIKNAFGTAPIAPISDSSQKALGRTNDAIIYGGSVTLHIDDLCSDNFEDLVAKNSPNYGKKMETVFKEVDYNFEEVDEEFFAPAEVKVNSVRSGDFIKYGEINQEMLKKSFELEE